MKFGTQPALADISPTWVAPTTELLRTISPRLVYAGTLNGRLWAADASRLWYRDSLVGRWVAGGAYAAATPSVRTIWITSVGVFCLRSGAQDSAGNRGFYLDKSTDGTGVFGNVLDTTATDTRLMASMPLSLIDCGLNGAGPAHHMVLLDYVISDAGASPAGERPRLWYSADSGATWTALFTTYAASNTTSRITHFHGGRYDAATGRLYAFTGDGNTNSRNRILWCTLAELIAGGGGTAVAGLWGLDETGTISTTRTVYVNTIAGNQHLSRTVDLYKHTDGCWYWATDWTEEAAGCHVMRWNETTGAVTAVGCALGVGWSWLGYTCWDGTVVPLLMTVTEPHGVTLSAYKLGCDKYWRIYALVGSRLVLLNAITTAQPPVGANRNSVQSHQDPFQWNEFVVFPQTGNEQLIDYTRQIKGVIGMVLPPGDARRNYIGDCGAEAYRIARSPSNVIPNGRFDADTTGWNVDTSNKKATITRITAAAEGVPAPEGGFIGCLQVAKPTADQGAQGSHTYYQAASGVYLPLAGQQVTLSARVYIPAVRPGANARQVYGLEINYNSTAEGLGYYRTFVQASDFTGVARWIDMQVSTIIPADVTALIVRLLANFDVSVAGEAEADAQPVYFSDVCLVPGGLPGPVGG